MKVIGLTGCIGSGKSEVAKILAELGAHIIDADLLAREAVAVGSPALAKLRDVFPAKFFLADGNLNRPLLAQHIFSNPKDKEALEAVIHPEVRRLFIQKYLSIYSKDTPGLLVYVVPLLLQARTHYPELQEIVVVTASKEKCLQRIISRDKCSPELANKKLTSQPSAAELQELANWVIKNDGDLRQLSFEVKSLYSKLLN